MENSGFLKTVNFGGFDKKDVLAYVDDLNTKIYTLESELEEARKNTNSDGASFAGKDEYEQMLSKERAKSSELSAKVDTLTLTLQSNESMIKDKDKEIESLKDKVADLENQLATAPASKDEEASFDIGNVFIEAKKSADKIIAEARNAVKKMNNDAKQLAEQVVDDANQKAKAIIGDAEAKSSKKIEEATIKSKDLEIEAENLKMNILKDVTDLKQKIESINSSVSEFTKSSSVAIERAKTILDETEKAVESDDYSPVSFSNLGYSPIIKTEEPVVKAADPVSALEEAAAELAVEEPVPEPVPETEPEKAEEIDLDVAIPEDSAAKKVPIMPGMDDLLAQIESEAASKESL